MSIYQTLLDKLHHGKSPYTGFPNGWAGTWYNDQAACRPFFNTVIARFKPNLIVEVGSFVGESTIFMAHYLKTMPQDSAILAVDTWMGGIDHWEKVPEKLKFWFGRPSLFYQFIGNVIERRCTDKILPLSLDSINAARLLKMLNIRPNMVYIDASHEQGDVLRDYEAYWDLLLPGGAFLCDDLTGWFPGVLHDWKVFTETTAKGIVPEVVGEKGLLVKP